MSSWLASWLKAEDGYEIDFARWERVWFAKVPGDDRRESKEIYHYNENNKTQDWLDWARLLPTYQSHLPSSVFFNNDNEYNAECSQQGGVKMSKRGE